MNDHDQVGPGPVERSPVARSPVEPDPCRWQLPDPSSAPAGVDLVGAGADLEPGTLLAAYRSGLFPMHVDLWRRRRLGWWSPDPRGVIPLDGLLVSRSLQRSVRRYDVTIDTAFGEVVDACAHEHDGEQWILPSFAKAYLRLHELGWAHSIEVRDADGDLVGGLYGVAIGGLFAGESMFHRTRNGSKVALVHLVSMMTAEPHPHRVLDVQWCTEHLASLGCIEISRAEYLRRLRRAVTSPTVDFAAAHEAVMRERGR
jgi:leucyl/phenylalanyl-tRNA--protein transferase